MKSGYKAQRKIKFIPAAYIIIKSFSCISEWRHASIQGFLFCCFLNRNKSCARHNWINFCFTSERFYITNSFIFITKSDKNKSIVIKKNLVKLLFQVRFSPHRNSISHVWIKTHVAIIRIQTIGPDLLELDSAGPPAEPAQDWKQVHVLHHSWTPWFWPHPPSHPHHTPAPGEIAEETHSDLGKVVFTDQPGANLVCADEDVLYRPTTVEHFSPTIHPKKCSCGN